METALGVALSSALIVSRIIMNKGDPNVTSSLCPSRSKPVVYKQCFVASGGVPTGSSEDWVYKSM